MKSIFLPGLAKSWRVRESLEFPALNQLRRLSRCLDAGSDMDFWVPYAYDCHFARKRRKNEAIIALCYMILTLTTCLSLQAQAQDNRFVVFQKGKHGYINQEGELVIPITLEGTYVLHFSEVLVSFAQRVEPEPARVPYVDKDGKLRIYPQEKWGVIETSGAVVISPQFDGVAEFSEGLAAVREGGELSVSQRSRCRLT